MISTHTAHPKHDFNCFHVQGHIVKFCDDQFSHPQSPKLRCAYPLSSVEAILIHGYTECLLRLNVASFLWHSFLCQRMSQDLYSCMWRALGLHCILPPTLYSTYRIPHEWYSTPTVPGMQETIRRTAQNRCHPLQSYNPQNSTPQICWTPHTIQNFELRKVGTIARNRTFLTVLSMF